MTLYSAKEWTNSHCRTANDEVAIVLATGRVHFFRLPFFPINFMQSVTTLWSRLLHITTPHTHCLAWHQSTSFLLTETVRRLVSALRVSKSNDLSGSSTANTPRISRLTSTRIVIMRTVVCLVWFSSRFVVVSVTRIHSATVAFSAWRWKCTSTYYAIVLSSSSPSSPLILARVVNGFFCIVNWTAEASLENDDFVRDGGRHRHHCTSHYTLAHESRKRM